MHWNGSSRIHIHVCIGMGVVVSMHWNGSSHILYVTAFVDGRPERLIYPTDSRGRLCGVHDDVKSVLTYTCTCTSVTSIHHVN